MAQRLSTIYRPGSYRPEESVTYLMRQITTAVATEVSALLGPDGLTHAQWVPLLKLHTGEASTPAELARVCYLDAGSMTRMIDRLEAKGFVRRTRSDADRRVVLLELTPQGREIAARIPGLLCEVQNAHLSGFTRAEVETLKSFLQRVLDNTQERQDPLALDTRTA